MLRCAAAGSQAVKAAGKGDKSEGKKDNIELDKPDDMDVDPEGKGTREGETACLKWCPGPACGSGV